jgi:hypothetical protein
MMSIVAAVLAETEELAPLLMPPLAFAGIATAVFIFLGFVVWSYRDVSNRHLPGSRKHDDSHGEGH